MKHLWCNEFSANASVSRFISKNRHKLKQKVPLLKHEYERDCIEKVVIRAIITTSLTQVKQHNDTYKSKFGFRGVNQLAQGIEPRIAFAAEAPPSNHYASSPWFETITSTAINPYLLSHILFCENNGRAKLSVGWLGSNQLLFTNQPTNQPLDQFCSVGWLVAFTLISVRLFPFSQRSINRMHGGYDQIRKQGLYRSFRLLIKREYGGTVCLSLLTLIVLITFFFW